MPMCWLNAYATMLPKLQAEEALSGISGYAIGSGMARRERAQALIAELLAAATAGDPVIVPTRAERLARAKLAGIRVSHG
jgi:hypothetical protein